MSRTAFCYTKAVVIVHGKSEFQLVEYIKSNLHLPIKTYAESGGRTSIQINGLNSTLNKRMFKSLKAVSDEFSIEYDRKTKKLKNFKLFIIMDTDDCTEETKGKYISGELFSRHPLKEYIVPIYNNQNLEDVMIKAGIMGKRISSGDKGEYYTKIFPINAGPLTADTVKQVEEFRDRVSPVRETNMEVFACYCLDQIENIK